MSSGLPSRANNLNALRLVLALAVLVSHVFPLVFDSADPGIGGYSLGGMAVGAFFLLSGHLVAASWRGDPRPRAYLAKRAARLMPGLWVCLLVTALVLAPLIDIVEGRAGELSWVSAATYVLAGSGLYTGQTSIDGVLGTVPTALTVNGSVYTLAYEAACYTLVLAAGVLGLSRRRAWWPAVSLAAWAVAVLLALEPGLDLNSGSAYTLGTAAGFGLSFALGASWHLFADRLPTAWSLVVLSAAAYLLLLTVPGVPGVLLRPVTGLCLMHVLMAVAHRTRPIGWSVRNDLSYGTYLYAFPVTQAYAAAGLDSVPRVGAVLVVTASSLALGWVSWRCVERPALQLVRRRTSHRGDALPASAAQASTAR